LGPGSSIAIEGNGGVDVLSFDGFTQAANLNLGDGKLGGVAFNTNIDNAWGSASGDTFSGNGNANSFRGLGGNDTLSGGLGNDTLDGGFGINLIDGGAGNDALSFADLDRALSVFATRDYGVGSGNQRVPFVIGLNGLDFRVTASGAVQVDQLDGHAVYRGSYQYGSGTGDVTNFQNVEEIHGTVFNDRFVGIQDTVRNAQGQTVPNGIQYNDRFFGGDGDDAVENAYGGDDYLDGGAGNDFMQANLGNDTCLGGLGDDLLLSGAGNDSLDGGEGRDELRGGDGIDRVLGGLGNDTLGLGADNDFGYGEGGDDSLRGQTGADYLSGGADNDILGGSTGNDTVEGGAGNDTVSGAQDFNLVTGGAGADTFRISASTLGRVNGGPLTVTGLGREDITDFNASEGDHLQVNITNILTPFTDYAAGGDLTQYLRFSQDSAGHAVLQVNVSRGPVEAGWHTFATLQNVNQQLDIATFIQNGTLTVY